MKSAEFTYARTLKINGFLVPRFRGQRMEQVIRDKNRYYRKIKHKGRKEW